MEVSRNDSSDIEEVRFWVMKGSSHPKSFVPVEVIPLPDTDVRTSHTRLLLHKNTNGTPLLKYGID